MKQPTIRTQALSDPADMNGITYVSCLRRIEITVESGSLVPLWYVPAGTLISKVTALVTETLDDLSAAVNIGHAEPDYDDFIDNQTMATAGTVATSVSHAPNGVYYSENTQLYLWLSSTSVSEGTLEVLIEYIELSASASSGYHEELTTTDNLDDDGTPVS